VARSIALAALGNEVALWERDAFLSSPSRARELAATSPSWLFRKRDTMLDGKKFEGVAYQEQEEVYVRTVISHTGQTLSH
jgi:hypothetical protein